MCVKLADLTDKAFLRIRRYTQLEVETRVERLDRQTVFTSTVMLTSMLTSKSNSSRRCYAKCVIALFFLARHKWQQNPIPALTRI